MNNLIQRPAHTYQKSLHVLLVSLHVKEVPVLSSKVRFFKNFSGFFKTKTADGLGTSAVFILFFLQEQTKAKYSG